MCIWYEDVEVYSVLEIESTSFREIESFIDRKSGVLETDTESFRDRSRVLETRHRQREKIPDGLMERHMIPHIFFNETLCGLI